MAAIDLRQIFSSSLLDGQINELNLQQEINNINQEIKTALKQQSTGQSLVDSNILQRINACISVLTVAKTELTAKNIVISKQAYLQQSLSTNALEEAEMALAEAKKALYKIREEVRGQYTRREIRLAIMEGYIIITQLREQLLGESIDYKIMTAGQKGDTVVLFEAHPTLAQVLANTDTALDTRSFSLKLTATRKQFNTILSAAESLDATIPLKNSILNQMEQVQLSHDQENMWNKLLKVHGALQNIAGAKMNYGQIIESFEEYLIAGPDPQLDEIEYIYQLLEKGRNNLAYYLGADVGQYQIKALTTMGSVGRADAATLTNVLNPLLEIKQQLELIHRQGPQALVDYFTPEKGQGDRPFNPALADTIKQNIKNAIKET